MKSLATLFLLALALAGPLLARAPADFEYGPRPEQAVFDPDQLLDPALAKDLSDPLVRNLKEEGVDVLVVVLKEIGDAPPEHVARQFAEAWCGSPSHCIVLHVPGKQDSPWIIPAGQLVDHLKADEVEKEVNDRQRRARAEPDDPHKVMAAAREAADLLRFWTATAIERSKTLRKESSLMRRELENDSWKKQIALLTTLASVVPLLAGIALICRIVRRRGPRSFPDHQWQQRLGAPHAGGNHAVTVLGPPVPRP